MEESSSAAANNPRPTSSEIRKLKSQAQRISNVTRLGHAGVTPAFIKGVQQELASHELVKVKFTDFKEQKEELGKQIADATGSHLIWIIGHVAVLYKRKAASKAAATEDTGD